MSGSPTEAGPYRIEGGKTKLGTKKFCLIGPDGSVLDERYVDRHLITRRDDLNAAYAAGYAAGRKESDDGCAQ